MGSPLAISLSDAAKNGVLIDFLNSCTNGSVQYNTHSEGKTYAQIDNLGILNRIFSDTFSLKLFISNLFIYII